MGSFFTNIGGFKRGNVFVDIGGQLSLTWAILRLGIALNWFCEVDVLAGTLSRAGTSSSDGIAPSSSLSLLSLPEPFSEELLFRLLLASGDSELVDVGVAEGIGVGTSVGDVEAGGLQISTFDSI